MQLTGSKDGGWEYTVRVQNGNPGLLRAGDTRRCGIAARCILAVHRLDLEMEFRPRRPAKSQNGISRYAIKAKRVWSVNSADTLAGIRWSGKNDNNGEERRAADEGEHR